MWGIGNTRPNLHLFQYIQAFKPFAVPVPPNTKKFQLILAKFQPVSSYTDPVPSSTTYNSSSRKAKFSRLNYFSFYGWFDDSRLGLVVFVIVFIFVFVKVFVFFLFFVFLYVFQSLCTPALFPSDLLATDPRLNWASDSALHLEYRSHVY